MNYSKENLGKIFDKTAGRCHLCGEGLYFNSFGKIEKRGAWEIEHSIPRSAGGTDNVNNLYPAHIRCNRCKSNNSTRSARRKNGITRAPYSIKKCEEINRENTFVGGGIGFFISLLLKTKPAGLIAGTLIGCWMGSSVEPD